MPSLSELQRDFAAYLLSGDLGGLAGLVESGGVAAAERLSIHRNTMLVSLTDALQASFPATCRTVDARFFAYAAHSFITATPPRGACVAEYGEGFADFLASFPPCRDLAWLPDLARLEWAMARAAQAEDAAALTAESLAAIAAESLADVRLQLHPSLGLLGSPHPVDAIWRANRSEEAAGEPVDLAAGGVMLEVRRWGEDVVMRPVAPAVFAFRDSLARGATLGSAVERAFAADADFDLAAALAALFQEQSVVAVLPATRTGEGRDGDE